MLNTGHAVLNKILSCLKKAQSQLGKHKETSNYLLNKNCAGECALFLAFSYSPIMIQSILFMMGRLTWMKVLYKYKEPYRCEL